MFKTLLKKVKIKPTPFIQFQITDRCNYLCEYCIQKKGEKEELDADDIVIDSFISLIHTLKGKWKFMLMGGEALIHPRFFEVAEIISENNHDIFLITNFSFTLDYYKKLVDICGNSLKKINASLHLSQIKSIETFIEKTIEFNQYKSSKTDFSVVSVLTNENFEILKEIKERLKKHNIKMSFQRLRIKGENIIYKEEIESYLNNNPEHSAKIAISMNNIDLKGTTCYTGYKSIRIDRDGSVTRCGTKHGELSFLGNISDETFKFFDKPMPCMSHECQCYNTTISNNMIELDLTSKVGRRIFQELKIQVIRRVKLFFN